MRTILGIVHILHHEAFCGGHYRQRVRAVLKTEGVLHAVEAALQVLYIVDQVLGKVPQAQCHDPDERNDQTGCAAGRGGEHARHAARDHCQVQHREPAQDGELLRFAEALPRSLIGHAHRYLRQVGPRRRELLAPLVNRPT